MKTNEEIDDTIKSYIYESTDNGETVYIYESPDNGETVYRREMGSVDKELVSTETITMNSSYYSDLLDDTLDTIDISNMGSLTTTVDPLIFDTEENKDITMQIDGEERSMRELFSTVDAISRRLAVLEPKKDLLDKYELLQSLYEQYKAAEAMLMGPDPEDEE